MIQKRGEREREGRGEKTANFCFIFSGKFSPAILILYDRGSAYDAKFSRGV